MRREGERVALAKAKSSCKEVRKWRRKTDDWFDQQKMGRKEVTSRRRRRGKTEERWWRRWVKPVQTKNDFFGSNTGSSRHQQEICLSWLRYNFLLLLVILLANKEQKMKKERKMWSERKRESNWTGEILAIIFNYVSIWHTLWDLNCWELREEFRHSSLFPKNHKFINLSLPSFSSSSRYLNNCFSNES